MSNTKEINEFEKICYYSTKINENCPIPNTHNRLNETHHLWHQTEFSYHDPILFRANLNATIQALRNITFIIQKEKKNIPGFDSWYNKCRIALKKDKISNWIHKSRNIIVKEGDLEISSIAKISLLNWYKIPIAELIVPPLLPRDLILDIVLNDEELNQTFNLNEYIIHLERHWSVVEFPDHDLLDLLSHAFKMVFDLVHDAHKMCFINDLDNENLCQPENISCILSKRDWNTSFLHLKNKKFVKPEMEKIIPNPKLNKKVAKRYNIEKSNDTKNKSEKFDLFKIAQENNELAKKMLTKDKYLVPVAFIFPRNTDPILMRCELPDNESKYLIYRKIAEKVKVTDAHSVIFVNESWISPNDNKATRAGLHPNREEAIMLIAISSKGKGKTYITPFKRSGLGKIIFSDTQVFNDIENTNLLNPLKDLWKI